MISVDTKEAKRCGGTLFNCKEMQSSLKMKSNGVSHKEKVWYCVEMWEMRNQRKRDSWLFSHSSVKSSAFLVSKTLESESKESHSGSE